MGDLIGARQSGGVELRHARLPVDEDLLGQARELASGSSRPTPRFSGPSTSRLRERAVARYPRAVELFQGGLGIDVAYQATLTPTPVASRSTPDLGLERDIVGLVVLAGELQHEHGGGAHQRGFADDQPAAGLLS